MKFRTRGVVPLLVAGALLAACGDDGGSTPSGQGSGSGSGSGTGSGTGVASGGGERLLIWTVEDLADRVEAQKRILADFTAATGIQADLVAVAEDQLTPTLTSAVAANQAPDIIGALSLGAVRNLQADDLLDSDVAGQVVEDLGRDTFAARALELTSDGDNQLAVPSDGWAQLLFYRKDLFDAAGLPAPDTYDAITQAATKLDQGDVAGIVAGTAPGDSFTQQSFEHFALANGCQLVDDAGNVTLDSPNCVESFRFYSDLIRDHSVRGNQDADTTRASYFAGKSAMVVWSSFLLDELAGLRDDALPTCSQCKNDREFLAKNTGVVAAIKGPQGPQPAAFGEAVSWAVLQGAATDEATRFVEYMMGDGYERWLAIAPEGKVPTRTGTAEDPQRFTTAWNTMQAGVDRKAPLSQFYGPDVLDQVVRSPETFSRWGLAQGYGELAGQVGAQFIVPKALSELINSGGDPAAAAGSAKAAAEQVKEDTGG